MAVSVALCTHNGARFIREQVASILTQSELPDELVVSDDASTDDTLALIDAEIAAHPDSLVAVRVLRSETPLGVTRNFERAISECRHELILLSDQDDVWAPNRVASTVAAFADPAVLLVHSDANLVDDQVDRLGVSLFEAYGVTAQVRTELAGDRAFDLLMRRNLVTGATTGIRRELAELARPFPQSWVHDEWLAIVAASVGRIRPIAEPLIDYRQHSGNQIGAVRLDIFAKIRRLVAPGWSRNLTLLTRASELADRYPRLVQGATAARVTAVNEKLRHERMRSGLATHRVLRVLPVVREALTGRYSRFGGGFQDVVRDLVQPLKPPK